MEQASRILQRYSVCVWLLYVHLCFFMVAFIKCVSSAFLVQFIFFSYFTHSGLKCTNRTSTHVLMCGEMSERVGCHIVRQPKQLGVAKPEAGGCSLAHTNDNLPNSFKNILPLIPVDKQLINQPTNQPASSSLSKLMLSNLLVPSIKMTLTC